MSLWSRCCLSLLVALAFLLADRPLQAQDNEALRAELETMFESDQRHRAALSRASAEAGPDSEQVRALWQAQTVIDAENLKRLREIIDAHGWPGRSQVGERAAMAAFLIVQHADLADQKSLLPLLQQAAEAGEMDRSQLAMLEDRILVGDGKPQRYGTQLSRQAETGRLAFNPIEDPTNVDARRHQIGLSPIDDFARAIGVDGLSRLSRDLCGRQVVLLGEDRDHAAAATFEAKAALVRRLVEQCGFGTVLFESAIYDFLNYQRRLKRDSASVDDLANAVGGPWTTGSELSSLLAYLHEQAQGGDIRVGGIDVQLGSTSALYAQRELPGELVTVLPEPEAAECEARLARHNQWRYDTDHPFDADERAALADCIERIASHLSATDQDSADLQQMVASYALHLRLDGDDRARIRSQGMLDNLLWYRDRAPAGRGVIVWTATVHALQQPLPDESQSPNLGQHLHRLLGDEVVSIGFSALAGSHGRGNATQTLQPASADSLEALAFSDEYSNFAYLDRTALEAAGARPSRVADYGQWHEVDWSTRLDGLLVVREERPVETIVREAGN